MRLKDKFISPTTQMLLKRMDDYPEDFVSVNSVVPFGNSWVDIAKHGDFSLIESILVKRKVRGIRRDATQKRILELLLDGQARQEPWENKYAHTTVGRFTQGPAEQQKEAEKDRLRGLHKAYEDYKQAQVKANS